MQSEIITVLVIYLIVVFGLSAYACVNAAPALS
jgi:hypothetical protein